MVTVRAYAALTAAGFRRFSTYRQATVAGAFANVAFGFLRTYVLLSVAGSAGELAGYDRAQLVTFVWVGQGLLAVVNAWGPLDMADRVRSGDVVADLLRPVPTLAMYLCADLGRAGFAMVTRFVTPVVVGLLAFEFSLPGHLLSYGLFAGSVLLAVVIAFSWRYMIGLSAFWLLDARGLNMMWVFLWGGGSGLYFPLPVLPGWLELTLWIGTPFPATMQAPLDIAVERGGLGHAALVLAAQIGWAAISLALCRHVQRRAWRKLVVQGG
ncbi:MAG TPA: ABC-2 family transporter protein [Actinophytocola sp.]|uniref:ABC transporter permease n=1 Tax=Actinophytocola sp. TaxID=1872138 RepID=UPI002DDD9B34|nr:ABC-2 family transporter protein [Actinophytocola sp.]HEV2781855.1 ABC-2 family transporter protein [Actinophytocola sp.]